MPSRGACTNGDRSDQLLSGLHLSSVSAGESSGGHAMKKAAGGRRGLCGLPAMLVAVCVLAAACTSQDSGGNDEGPGDDETGASTTTVTSAPWTTDEAGGVLTIHTGAMALSVSDDPFTISASPAGGGEEFFAEAGGLYLVRDGRRVAVSEATGHEAAEDSVSFAVSFDDGSTGLVELRDGGRPDSVAVAIRPDDTTGVSAWGESLASPDDELIYGLTERTVDDISASEYFPREVGSLDRKGETVEMWIRPTMSGYAPFHQSSKGYGLLVDGFMPGRYDVGATDPNVVELEFEWDPDSGTAGYHLFYGPAHSTILQAYYDLTGRPPVPPDHVFEHWRGYDEHPVGEPVEVDGVDINAEVADDLAHYEEYGIPAGLYHFDRPWTVGELGFEELVFDPERYPNAAEMLAILAARGWHMHVWVAPWAMGSKGDEAAELGYLAPGSDRESASILQGVSVDLTNPDAVEWYKQDFLEFLDGPEGSYVDGFMMDRGDEPDVSSEPDDIWFDGRNGHQIHNWYPVEFDRVFREIIDEARPEDGYLLARAGYTGSQAYVMRWGGDTHGRDGLAIPEAEPTEAQSPSTDLGLRSVLISMQRAAFMGTPYWGHDIGGYNGWLDREVYGRWIEVGFASPIMRFHGPDNTPWNVAPDGGFDQELLDIYKGYVLLRHDMNGYLAATAEQASEDGIPMVRPLVFAWPAEAGASNRWDEWMLGDDLLVAPVWQSGARERTVWIPPGEWVDFWDHDEVVSGPTEITVDAPLGKLPMWVTPGSGLLDIDVDEALTARAHGS
ncbi:MAG: glycoside hydrolase family 31 protein [Actinobacteria bacterium]|nr:MAG: glycoside hydrolase family 31 protein [Actinomycetota bacterium]